MAHDARMHSPDWLPPEFRDRTFTLRAAEEVGIGSTRRHGDELLRPFRGIRSTVTATTPTERCRDYLPRLKPPQVFAGVTALRLFGLPWTHSWFAGETLEVAVRGNGYSPRSKGVIGHRMSEHRMRVTRVEGLPVLEPATAVMDVAARVDHEHLVGLLDALLTPSSWYPSLRSRPLVASLDDLAETMSAWRGSAQASRAKAALRHVRVGVDSYPESVTRVLLERSGTPQVTIQIPVSTDLGVRSIDGGWPELKVGFEYEGEHHRLDKHQWQRDIGKMEALQRAGWLIIRVTARDLLPENRPALVRRIHAALRSRGWPQNKKSR